MDKKHGLRHLGKKHIPTTVKDFSATQKPRRKRPLKGSFLRGVPVSSIYN